MKKTNSTLHFSATLPHFAIQNTYERKCHRRSQTMTHNQHARSSTCSTKGEKTHKPGTSKPYIKCHVNQLIVSANYAPYPTPSKPRMCAVGRLWLEGEGRLCWKCWRHWPLLGLHFYSLPMRHRVQCMLVVFPRSPPAYSSLFAWLQRLRLQMEGVNNCHRRTGRQAPWDWGFCLRSVIDPTPRGSLTRPCSSSKDVSRHSSSLSTDS